MTELGTCFISCMSMNQLYSPTSKDCLPQKGSVLSLRPAGKGALNYGK